MTRKVLAVALLVAPFYASAWAVNRDPVESIAWVAALAGITAAAMLLTHAVLWLWFGGGPK